MGGIKLNLVNEDLFKDDELCLNTNITFLFGKNGTGKTTLTELIGTQISNYDVRIFQGFNGVVGANNRLNAVILGDENNEIDTEIETKNVLISQKRDMINKINDNIQESEENADNLWIRYNRKRSELTKQQTKIEGFYTKSARDIKNMSTPQISDTSFNKNRFESEIAKAQILDTEEIAKMKRTLSVSVREVKQISKCSVDVQKLLDEANKLLMKKVNPRVVIEEFYGNKGKENFSEEGLRLHEIGEKCAFCGSVFTAKREEKLRLFFSADEMDSFRKDITNLLEKIDASIKCINSLESDTNNFYPAYIEEGVRKYNEFSKQKEYLLEFLNTIQKETDDKLKSLNEVSKPIKSIPLVELTTYIESYNALVKQNNDSNLTDQQKKAKKNLRYHEIKKCLDEFKYDVEKTRLDELQKAFDQLEKDVENERLAIKKLEHEITALEGEISQLRAITKNEEKLADEINKKLKLYVSFELVYMKDVAGEGFYQIRCNRTSEIREVDKVSSGEKNIIAFLYFMQKLSEVNDGIQLPKLIVLDDPMCSNDDTMQYIIIEELQNLFPSIKGDNKIVLLTHNSHFYLNAKYTIKSYSKNTFMHLRSNGNNVEFHRINNVKDDFKTNYEVLWKELRFLYDASEANPAMMLNPIRRIIETYAKFNVLSMKDMLMKVVGAAKLFHVNSHSIDDLEAELNGLDKQSIIRMLEECFSCSGASDHFKQHWENTNNLSLELLM